MTREGTLKSTISMQVWITIWLSIVPTGFGANILIVCPFFAKSTHGFHVAIGKSLHAAGHQITIVTPFAKDAASKNLTAIDSSLSNQSNESNFADIYQVQQLAGAVFSILLWDMDMSEKNCDNTIQLDEIQKILHSTKKKFDVMILDLIQTLHDCFLPIAEILDIPVIGTSSTKLWWRTDWLIGNPNNPAAIPAGQSLWSLKMNFMQRLTNSRYWTIDYLTENLFAYPKLRDINKKHFPNLSVAGRIRPSLIFTNGHQILVPRPLVPNNINIGGIHVETQPAKPLPQDLQNFIDEAKDGVILLTFGSMVKMFEENSSELNILKTVFAKIPQRVIWKMENEVGDLPKNVMTSKWLPQRDILAHKNVIAFFTHCGLSGIFEALFEAKPLIMMPIFFDQISNSAILEDLGVGIALDMKELSVEKVLKAVNSIINDSKYQKQMQNISKIVKDANISREESVVYWTEYVIKHKGAPHLRTNAADMPLYEYLLIDVILFVSGVISALVYFLFWGYRKIRTKNHINQNLRKFK